jgi:hypothetical protein
MTWRDFYYSSEFQPLDGVRHATHTHTVSLRTGEDEGVSKQKQEKHFRLICIILGT